jgi:hypothetical protein
VDALLTIAYVLGDVVVLVMSSFTINPLKHSMGCMAVAS